MHHPSDANIHPTAIVDPGAKIGSGVTVGPFTIIEDNTRIGDGSIIGSHVLVGNGARLGQAVQVWKGAVIAATPQDLKFEGELTEITVGDRTQVREFCTLARGTKHGGGLTVIGRDCLLMAYTHVAHDCRIGNNIILANGVNMAGHVTIQDWVSIGGLSVIHQFATIGEHAFIGGHGRISRDVPPYIITLGEEYNGLNVVGLRRRGFSTDQVTMIKRVYRIIYREKLNLTQALGVIDKEVEMTPEVKTVLSFIAESKRGIVGI